jgi:hypothetical protein
LTTCHHLAQRLAAALIRAGRTPAVGLLLIAGLAGCHHKTVAYVIPHPAQAPIPLDTIPPPDLPALIASLPSPELPPLPLPPPPKPAPRKKPSPKEEPQPPAQVASMPAPAASAIGTLSTGGDAAPQSQQQAQGLIASILKRIAALPAKTADAQKKQIRQINNFLTQAQKALNSGDADGAFNLATKARLLMDDLEKK